MQLWQQSAHDLVRALRARHVSAREAAAAAIARIEQTQKTVNAIATNRFEQALDEASAFDQGSRTTAPTSAQLAGLPIIIKDMTEVVGLPTTLGDPRRANTPAPRSDLCVERLERNGGIVLAKSNVPYMGLGYDTTNPLFGTTLNPWNTGRSTGGSSGGAAAALACGAAWLAHGTDLGGSIRGPAGNCGVVGSEANAWPGGTRRHRYTALPGRRPEPRRSDGA